MYAFCRGVRSGDEPVVVDQPDEVEKIGGVLYRLPRTRLRNRGVQWNFEDVQRRKVQSCQQHLVTNP